MRYLLCLFVFIDFSVSYQTELDQEVFKNKVWRVIDISSSKKSFFDRTDKYLGSKEDFASKTIYKDKWKRTIKVIHKSNATNKALVNTKKKNKILDSNKRMANQVIVRRNKAVFYDENGSVSRTAKRRRRKVFFHNSDGKLIGYKIYKRDGTKTYKDPKGRTTGRSYIDKSGRLIYRAKNRRIRTPRVLFEDPFLYSR